MRRLGIVGLMLVLALGLWTLAWSGRISEAPSRRAEPVVIEPWPPRGPERAILVFVDSLSREIATDAERMPTLSKLAGEGAAFEVEPCRDQLTYLCLRAVLTGHDDSSLLAIADNFRPDHDGPARTLLSELAERGERIVVVGSNDFHPYRAALTVERALSKRQETPERVLAELGVAEALKPALVIVSLASGDMAAHAYGTGSAEYDEAFRRIDDVVASIAQARDPGTHLIVFGDHGHDVQGRHLPGTASKTWAVYHGPAFRSGAYGRLHITDHRALLGVLLGVATEATYAGPALETIFRASWVRSAFTRGVPSLERKRSPSSRAPVERWLGAGGIAASVVLLGWLSLRRARSRNFWRFLVVIATAAAAAVGFGFDGIRSAVHDHGGEPERGLWLLVPLALAGGVAWAVRRHGCERRMRWLRVGAAATALVPLLLLLPTAYYYGSRRAIVLGSIGALALLTIDYLTQGAKARERLPVLISLAFTALVLASYYPVRQLGPETAGAAAWALDAAVYREPAWLTRVLSTLLLGAVVAVHGARSRPVDALVSGTLFAGGVLLGVAGLALPRLAQLGLLLFLVVGAASRANRGPRSLFAAALLLLAEFYGAKSSSFVALQLLLTAAVLVLRSLPHLRLTPSVRSVAGGLTAAVSLYLLFWPTVGFHLVGIDFAHMFRWVRPEDYERAWWLIGLGVVVKLALPLVLVVAVAHAELRRPRAAWIFAVTLAAKALLLCVMISCYAVHHEMNSQQALAMLAELCLVLFGFGVGVVALPRRLAEPRPFEYPTEASTLRVAEHEY